MRGEQIAKEKVISENADGSFSVPSQTVEEIAYLVRLIDNKYLCNCPDFKFKEVRKIEACKHIHAIKFWIATQVELKQEVKPKIFAEDSIQCDKCGSIRVIRYGKCGNKQAFYCKDCKHKFVPSLLKKAHYSPETISLTLDLYFSGLSLRGIARIMQDNYGYDIQYLTVYRWIQKFVPIVSEYVNSLAPSELSDTWHADEVFQHMKGGVKVKSSKRVAFVWNVMDRKTRFMLASKLSQFRDEDGAVQAFNTALANAHGFKPDSVLTDSLKAYKSAIPKTLGQEINHVANCGIGNKPHATNNRIERANGTERERFKIQRGWKSMETQIPEGRRIHYNFVKPHMAIEGMTPAQRAGINGQTRGKWMDLLELALEQKALK